MMDSWFNNPGYGGKNLPIIEALQAEPRFDRSALMRKDARRR